MTRYRVVLDSIDAGNWAEAHSAVQDGNEPMDFLLHGYLHRMEGDLGNASYWYQRAGELLPENTLAEELERLRSMINGL